MEREELSSNLKAYLVNELHIDITSSGADKLADHILKLKKRWEIEARMDELKEFTYDSDYPIFNKAKERISELQSQLEEVKEV